MASLIIGLCIFMGIHATRIVMPGLRDRQIESLGEGAWKGIYTTMSFGGLALAGYGWTQYRLEAPDIYNPFSWAPHLTATLVLLAFIFISAAYGPVGRIKAVLVHPMMIGVMLWSVGHLLANGDLASLILFGSFAAYSVWYLIAVRSRGEPVPVFASYAGDAIAIVAGAVGFGVFAFVIHAWLFNVSPF